MSSEKLKIFMGVEAPSNPSNKGDVTKGIYGFAWQGRTPPGGTSSPSDGISSERTPQIELLSGGSAGESDLVSHTPRFVACINDSIYAISRDIIYIIDRSDLHFKEQSYLSDLFRADSPKKECKEVVDKPSTAGGVTVTPPGELFLSLYLTRDGEKQKERKGYLLFSPSGKLDSLTVLDGYVPSGKPVLAGENKVLVPCGNRLETILLEEKEGQREVRQSNVPHYPMSGSILSVASLEGVTICTDDQEGYMIISEGRRKELKRGAGNDLFLASNRREYLPSEATSCTLLKYNQEKYALFGVDDGKILVYRISLAPDGEPTLNYQNTASFISKEGCVDEGGKDNHIYDLKVHEDWVNFHFHNLYLRIGFPKLMGLSQMNRIIPQQEDKQAPKEDYLKNLMSIYTLDRICWVPHRITCGDFFEP
ncbi:hypothetical protein HZC32_03755 [Candidatus Woesearchaeota archaeon]|nr:hypothetical protein [Candidatus Woesearchaeota archaeon]